MVDELFYKPFSIIVCFFVCWEVFPKFVKMFSEAPPVQNNKEFLSVVAVVVVAMVMATSHTLNQCRHAGTHKVFV